MTQTISTTEFLRSGTFGPIAIESPGEVARDLLGEPDDIGRGGETVIWRYGRGRFEVSLSKGRVVLIAFYPHRGGELPNDVVVVHDLPVAERSSVDRFTRWLEQEGLGFEVLLDDAEQALLRVHGGATAVFADGRLDSLQAG